MISSGDNLILNMTSRDEVRLSGLIPVYRYDHNWWSREDKWVMSYYTTSPLECDFLDEYYVKPVLSVKEAEWCPINWNNTGGGYSAKYEVGNNDAAHNRRPVFVVASQYSRNSYLSSGAVYKFDNTDTSYPGAKGGQVFVLGEVKMQQYLQDALTNDSNKQYIFRGYVWQGYSTKITGEGKPGGGTYSGNELVPVYANIVNGIRNSKTWVYTTDETEAVGDGGKNLAFYAYGWNIKDGDTKGETTGLTAYSYPWRR